MKTNAVKVEITINPTPKIVLRGAGQDISDSVVRDLESQLGVSKILARILAQRGIQDAESARAFLSPSLQEHLPDPSHMKNIEQAAELILLFVKEKKLITIFTDFDVDGVTSGAQLLLFLEVLGARVNSYTPNRFSEGYGLSKEAVRKLAEHGTQLLITADCGISSVQEIAIAKQLGLATIIIDHHLPGESLPAADCIVNPAQGGCAFKEYYLATAGIVWLLLIVLRKKLRSEGAQETPDPKDFLDLAALGTICDMVPLKTLNRLIAHRGIEAIGQSKRPGMLALKEAADISSNKRLNAGHLSFALGPRINASGRLDHAGKALELLSTSDSLRAKKLAEHLNKLNTQRRGIEERVKKACLAELGDAVEHVPAYAVYGEDFHLGVIGLAAQRLVENFYRPAAVMGPGEAIVKGEKRQVVKGSVRTIKGFHVADALSSLSHLLLSHGGHAEAGGFSLLFENLEEFKKSFVEKAGAILRPEDFLKTYSVDLELSLSEIDFKLIDELSRMAPFGIGNPSPTFLTKDVKVGSVIMMNGGHLRFKVEDKPHIVDAVYWNGRANKSIRKDNIVSICYRPEIQNYRGISSVQLNVVQAW